MPHATPRRASAARLDPVTLVRWALLQWLVLAACALALAGSARAATAPATGVWTFDGHGYLALMQDGATGTVVALQVEPTLASGVVYVGTRSGDAMDLRSLDGRDALAITLAGSTFAGTVTHDGMGSAASGALLFAYAGSARDGIWQSQANPMRYLLTLSLVADGAPLMLLVDVAFDAATWAVQYDVATGVVADASSTFLGHSLTSARTITLAFATAVEPATLAYTAMLPGSRPGQPAEQFGATRILGVAP